MEFCPKCRSILLASEGKLKCRNPKCGYEKSLSGATYTKIRKARRRELTILEEGEEVLPTTITQCPQCGNPKAYWWMRQMRGGDEPETRFYRCTKCGKTWRELA
jgi:DNA-directed RNA polymerase subunit M